MKKIYYTFYLLLVSLPIAARAAATPPNPLKSLENIGEKVYNSGVPHTPELIIGNAVKILLSLVGMIFMILIIYAGIMWMTSAGNEKKIDTAKKIITQATIGLILSATAYMITYWVTDVLQSSVLGTF